LYVFIIFEFSRDDPNWPQGGHFRVKWREGLNWTLIYHENGEKFTNLRKYEQNLQKKENFQSRPRNSHQVVWGHKRSRWVSRCIKGTKFLISGNSFDIPIKNCSLCEESISNKNFEKPVLSIGFGQKQPRILNN